MSIGKNIYKYRKQKGMSIDDLAKIVKVDRSEIVNWENDLSTPEYINLRLIANALEVSIWDLETPSDNSENDFFKDEKPESSRTVSKENNVTNENDFYRTTSKEEKKINQYDTYTTRTDDTYRTSTNNSYKTGYNGSIKNMFASFLQEDEELLWEGKAGPVSAVLNIFPIIFGIFFFGFAIFWTASATAMGGPFGLFGIPFIIIGIFIVFVAPKKAAEYRNNTYYAVTNKRIIRLINTTRQTINEIKLNNVEDINLMIKEGGNGTITINDSRRPYHSHHHRYYSSNHYNTMHTTSSYNANYFYALENIENAREVYNIISQLVNNQKK